MAQDKNKLKSNIIHGFGTLIAREFFLKIFSFVGQIFLARLLVPSEFGIYVIIVFLVSFLSLFSDIGFNLAIIQKKLEPTHAELSGIFLIKVFLSCLLILLIFILSPLLKEYYSSFNNENITMLRVFSLTILLTNLRAIPISLLERKLKYNVISSLDILGVFIYYVVSIAGAFMGLGVWSFILGAMVKESVETMVIYIINPFIPALKFKLKDLKQLMKFGFFIQGNILVTFLNSSITPAIAGRISGPGAVGLLDFSSNIALIPETIGINFGRVAFSGYSRIQEQKKLLTTSINKSMSMLSIMFYFFPVVIFGLGAQIVILVFSQKWEPSIPALYWYSASVFFLPVLAALGQGILVIGKSKEIFKATLISGLLGWMGAYILINRIGFVAIAIIYFLVYISLSLFYVYIFKKENYNFPIISILLPKVVAMTCSLITIYLINLFLPQTILFLILKLIVCAFSYLIFLIIFVKQDTLEFIKLIFQWLKIKKYD